MYRILTVLILGFTLSACFSYSVQNGELGQNWNRADQRLFYNTSQGSQLLKYDWFLALEQAGNNQPFVENSLRRFGYLADPFAATQSPDNSHLLPVGFVRDDGPGYIGEDEVSGPWIGLTCAACHTAEIEIAGARHVIDGAPTNADFYELISSLSASLDATVADSGKYSRFAAKVSNDGSLQDELEKAATHFNAFVSQSTPVHEWGKGRLDAVGLILNTVGTKLVPNIGINSVAAKMADDKFVHLPKRTPVPPRVDNTHLPDAPVSYPFLWDTYQQVQNQWNGVSVGTLSRNTTEVLGVFATFNPEKPRDNSVDFRGLKTLQGLVTNLRSPKWTNPDYGLPTLDAERITRGKVLYEDHCASCHKVHDRNTRQVRRIGIELSRIDVVGTDDTMATNFVDNTFALKEGGQLVHAKDLVASALTQVWLKSVFGALIYGGVEELVNNTFSKITSDLEVYKARPLNGIWATAPYMHNGSIPNMDELLKPVDQRVKEFCVGSRVLDPVNLGFESDLDVGGDCGRHFKLDTSLPGNLNVGHDSYSRAPFSQAERLDIIEFIKSE